ncbi:MAG: serine hydrolase domain-containing protein [Lysobacterales bacterium]
MGNEPLQTPLTTLAFTPPESSPLAAQPFSGVLTLVGSDTFNRIEVVKDTFGISGETQWKLSSLPDFSFEYVSDGATIIPVLREPQRSDHPYWEIMLEPGRVWADPLDMGWSRAALPFTLKEKNQNCTHNGLLTFLYKDDGSITRAAWQIGSETCLYLKINLWGIAAARYQPTSIPEAENIIADYRDEVEHRLQVKPVSTLAEDYPAVNPAAFIPPGAEDSTVYGFVLNGTHYRSQCPTRFGPYPFCDVLDLPSYSLAKSVFAGLGYLLLTHQWPEFADTPITGLIPECILDDDRWRDVTPRHLLNMTTGLYQSSEFQSDENSSEMQTFFMAETHAGKLRFSCEAWPKKAAAGTVVVYHTTDDYLLGVAMNAFLKVHPGSESDIYNDLVYERFLKPLQLSPVSHWTQRTYDKQEQPFTAYGLIFHSDDIAKISTTLNSDSALNQNLDSAGLKAAMFLGTQNENIRTGQYGEFAYHNGFWGMDMAKTIGCQVQTWIPFMSGFGGIVVAMFPNGAVYYYFSDSDQYTFKNAAVEANKVLNYCEEL